VGRLLTWNTLRGGGRVGLRVFILMPKAGLRNAFNLLALALWRAGFAVTVEPRAACRSRHRRGGSWLNRFVPRLATKAGGMFLSSGVFRSAKRFVDTNMLKTRKRLIENPFLLRRPRRDGQR